MKKTFGIDLSSDRLIAIASDMVDDHNYIGALKMLNKNSRENYDDEDSFMLYAEIFDDLGIYEKCINYWFRYLDCTDDEDLSDAYEGLAISYMNLGNDQFSAFYYNEMLKANGDIDFETRQEIMDNFLFTEKNPLKIVYPPKFADCSDIISDGIDLMRGGEYDKAIENFSSIDSENKSYLSARNYIAMCHIICDDNDKAEEECLSILKKFPNDVQALTTLAAVRGEQKRTEESRELAKKLLSLNVTDRDDIYKIATVCCENKMHAEAYKLLCKLDGETEFDKSVMYFKAVSAYNCGKYKESFAAFENLLTVYPDSVIAEWNFNRAKKAQEEGNPIELDYFYRLPEEERETTFKILASFARLNSRYAEKLAAKIDISDCILWCLDATERGAENELYAIAATCAVKAGLDGLVERLLLNAFLPDGLKVHILTLLGERNSYDGFGAVICNIYKKVYFKKLELGRVKRKMFVSAYATLVAHFAIVDAAYGDKFFEASEKLYSELEKEGRLEKVTNLNSLIAAIFYKSGVKDPKVPREGLAEYFGASEKKISQILGEE